MKAIVESPPVPSDPGPPIASRRTLPRLAAQAQVWIDFDGTITQKDVIDELLRLHAADEGWKSAEADWQSGAIGSFDCLRRQFASVRIARPTLDGFLASIPLDPHARELFAFLGRHAITPTIVSDGIESFIRTILGPTARGATIRANRIALAGDVLTLGCPHRFEGCTSRAAHCKCATVDQLGDDAKCSIYIGDGRSDFCVAKHCDVIFAKGTLARLMTESGRDFILFETLGDVLGHLREMWEPRQATPVHVDVIANRVASVTGPMEQLLARLIRIPSLSGQEAVLTRHVADWARDTFEVDLWQARESELGPRYADFQRHLPLAERPSLVLRLPGKGGGRSLILNAHADVVAPGNLADWNNDPWSGHVEDAHDARRIFGRGACDTKGPLVSALWAMTVLADPALRPRGDVLLELVPGEEDCVALGTLASIARGHTADACIILEPTDGEPRCASRPGTRFTLTIAGRSVHGTCKWTGVDAIAIARDVLAELDRAERDFNDRAADPLFAGYPLARPISVDYIRGGDWQGMVCDRCEIAGYFELLPRDDVAAWSRRLSERLTARFGSGLTVRFTETYQGHRLDPAHPLCRAVESAGGPVAWGAFNSGCEAGARATYLGTPTLVFGPGSLLHAHAANEHVDLAAVRSAAENLVRYAKVWCS